MGQPSLVLSSGFWAFPDPYYTIPGRNRAARLFFSDFAADAFLTDIFFQNEQNRSKNDTNLKSSILGGWNAPVTSWIVEGRLKRFPCEFWTFCESNYRVAERIVVFS